MDKDQIIQGIEKDGIYNFISMNYQLFTKEQLATILMILDHSITGIVYKPTYNYIIMKIQEELENESVYLGTIKENITVKKILGRIINKL